MVGENGLVIFKHKLRLEDGYGHGDFFIPVSVSSGNYKLIGCTRWMLNWGEEVFFQEDISILNPYTNAQKPFLGGQEAAAIPNNTPSKSSGDNL